MSMNLATPLQLPPPEADPQRLRVVPRSPAVAPRMPFAVLVGLILLAGVVGLLFFNTQMQQAAFAVTGLQEQRTHLAARQQTLLVELEQLRNPQRLAEAAQAQGLVIPPTACTLSLPGGAVTDSCAPATADHTPQLQGPAPAKPRVLQAEAGQRAGEQLTAGGTARAGTQAARQNARHHAQVPGSGTQDR